MVITQSNDVFDFVFFWSPYSQLLFTFYKFRKTMGSVKVPAQKVILCGEYGAGKSSLFRR